MVNLKRKVLAGVITAVIASAGAFAQKGGDDKRPPKGDTQVVVRPKEKDRPPQNNNQGDKNKGDKRGKP